MILNKIIWWLQAILPIALLIKVIIVPHIYKLISKQPEELLNESEVKKYYHKREGKTNELYTLALFLYSFLIVWLNWPKVLQIIEHYINSSLGNVGNYIGAILETSFITVLQLHIYKYAIAQKIDVKDSISKLSIYRNCNSTLIKNIYKYLTIETFLQAAIIGLIPFFQVDNYFYADAIVIVDLIISLVHILSMQAVIHSYSNQHFYLRTWTIFVVATIFNNIANALLNIFDGFLDLSYGIAISIWLFFKMTYITSALFQFSALFINIIQTKSMEEWYDD